MALMMIFLVAFSLFKLKTNEELEPVAQIKAEQMLNFQRQELIMALERAEEFYQIRYGLKAFASVDENDLIIYDGTVLIVNGTITPNSVLKDSFVNGAKNAYNDYSTPETLPENWRQRVIMEASIEEVSLQDGNNAWLNEQINNRIDKMENQVSDLQLQAATKIQEYLSLNPTKVEDFGIKSLLEQYVTAAPDVQKMLINELDLALQNYAFNYLEKQTNAPLIKESKK